MKKFRNDILNYLLEYYNYDIRKEYFLFRKFFVKNTHCFDEQIILSNFVSDSQILNKKLINWFISIGKVFYNIKITYNTLLLLLINNHQNQIYSSFSFHTINMPFRHKQKYIKNNSKIKLRKKLINNFKKNFNNYKKRRYKYRIKRPYLNRQKTKLKLNEYKKTYPLIYKFT